MRKSIILLYMSSGNCCECRGETCVCRLKVECNAKVGGNLKVRGDTDLRGNVQIDDNLTVNGAILPHRYIQLSRVAPLQSIPNDTPTVLIWNHALSSAQLNFNLPGTNFIVPQTGIYSFTAQVRFGAAPASGSRDVFFAVNDVPITHVSNAPPDAGVTLAGASAVWYVNAGDRVACWVRQTSGSALNIEDFSDTKWMITQLR